MEKSWFSLYGVSFHKNQNIWILWIKLTNWMIMTTFYLNQRWVYMLFFDPKGVFVGKQKNKD
jgi:hypothetical protein